MTLPTPNLSPELAGKLPVQNALTRALVLLATLVLSVSFLAVFIVGAVLLRDHARDNLRNVAWQASYVAEVAVVFSNRSAASDAVQTAVNQDGVTAITVRNADGTVLARVLRSDLSEDDISPGLLDPQPVTQQIINGGTRIGEVTVEGETVGIYSLLFAFIAGAAVASLLAWWIAQLVGARLRRTIAEPLRAIAETAHAYRLGEGGSARAPRALIAEVDELSIDFNMLLDELDGWRAKVDSRHKSLLDQANHDPLSGLANRAYFTTRLAATLTEARRSVHRFAVLYMDANDFKLVNDRFGHRAGDGVIKAIADRLSALCKHDQIAARVGGDEFAMLLPSVTDNQSVVDMIRRIQEAMANSVQLDDRSQVLVNVSIGAAIFPDDGNSVDALIAHSDSAMYKSKAQQKNQSRVTEDTRQ